MMTYASVARIDAAHSAAHRALLLVLPLLLLLTGARCGALANA